MPIVAGSDEPVICSMRIVAFWAIVTVGAPIGVGNFTMAAAQTRIG